MSVSSFLAADHPTAFSFEILPPLRGNGVDRLFETVERLMPFCPAYVNVTSHRVDVSYVEGPDGSFRRLEQQRRPGSTAIAVALKMRYGLTVVPHVICAGNTVVDLENQLIDLAYMGITDLLVLRGDGARDGGPAAGDGHGHAIGLCRQVSDFNAGLMADGTGHGPAAAPFTFGVAGYPEKHEEAMNPDTDMEHLKAKVDAGAGYVVTQMFFDNSRYFDFVARCRLAGIHVPIVPGIKPLSSLRQGSLLPRTFHIDFPEDLARALRSCATDGDVRDLGVEWATCQARELKAAGVPSIHFYTLGASTLVERVARNVY